jgi:hypothetical protein
MARSRNIKPGLFKNEVLGEADPNYTLLFEGLWVLADKAGRLEYRPKRIKAEIFPYRDVDVCMALAWLKHESFINLYEIDGVEYIQVANWLKHQTPHHKETESEIPPPPKEKKQKQIQDVTHAQAMHESSMDQASAKEIAPVPLIPDSLNLIPSTDARPPRRFTPPELAEVQEAIEAKGYRYVDAESFLAFYNSNGWKVGKNKMVSWQQALVGWESRKKSEEAKIASTTLSPMGRYQS